MPYDGDDTPISSQKLTSFFYAATTSTADNNWPTIKPNQIYSGDVNRDARGPEPRLRPADHAADRLEGDDQGGDRRHGGLAAAAAPPATSG